MEQSGRLCPAQFCGGDGGLDCVWPSIVGKGRMESKTEKEQSIKGGGSSKRDNIIASLLVHFKSLPYVKRVL